MKTKIQNHRIRYIPGMILIILLAVSFQSCQKDEVSFTQEEGYLKSATVPEYFSIIISAVDALDLNKGISNSLVSKINNSVKNA
jgi:hypothetical protein